MRRPIRTAVAGVAALALLAVCATASHRAAAVNPGGTASGIDPTARHMTVAARSASPADHLVDLPTHGMPGQVQVAAAAAPTSTNWVVLLDQCLPCQAHSGTHTTWTATSNNAGASWSIRHSGIPTNDVPGEVAFTDAAHGWTDRGYGTTTGGRSWHRETDGYRPDSLSAAGSTLWAVDTSGVAGADPGVLRTSSRGGLAPTHQPPITGDYAGTVTAASAISALLDVYDHVGEQLFTTNNAGRSWTPGATPCPAGYITMRNVQGRAGILWQVCASGMKVPGIAHLKLARHPIFRLAVSTDAGRQWSKTTLPLPRWSDTVVPLSAQRGWATDGAGKYYYTDDGGRRWQLRHLPTNTSGGTQEAFLARGSSAEIVFGEQVRSGTVFLVAHTGDSGRSWQESLIPVPHS